MPSAVRWVASGATLRNFVQHGLLLALLVLATGCQLDLRLGVTLDDDGGGELALSLVADQDLVEQAAAAGVDPFATLAERVEALGGPWEVREEEGADVAGRTVVVRAGFGGPDEFALRYEELRAGLDAPEAAILGPLALVQDEETGIVRLTGEVPLELREAAAIDQGVDLPSLLASLDGVLSHTVEVRTPVTVLETSQQGVEPEEGGEVITTAVPLGGRVPVDVSFQPPGLDVAQLVLYGGGGLLAILLVAAGVLAERRRG